MNLHDIKIVYKHAQMFSSIHKCLQAYASMYAMRSNLQVTPSLKQKEIKHCINS